MCQWIGYYDQKMDTICKAKTLMEAVGIFKTPDPIVSVIGAGGKTTTIHQLAEEYVQNNSKVVVMTTTHMIQEEEPWVCIVSEDSKRESVEADAKRIFQKYRQLWIGSKAKNGKMSQPPEWCMETIFKTGNPIVIEADGAKRLPLKVPAAHEPVVLPQTTHVMSVYGLDSIGQTLEECCCRVELAAELLETEKRKKVTPEDIAFFAGSEYGGKKGCPENAEYIVVLNKADTEEKMQQALKISRLLSKCGVNRIVVSTYRNPKIS